MNKNILLCVSGGIAVYKAVALVSKLSQAGATVKVIMTKSARQFVNPLSFQVMSKNDVFFDTFDEKDSNVIAHIDLADWADLIIVAPATANVIGKLANGIADDMVTTTLLAATAPVWIAPAMNVHMYDHPAVKRNIERLSLDGYQFIEPSEGFLACGYVGKGRLEEPEKISALVREFFLPQQKPLVGKHVIVTAGSVSVSYDEQHRISTNASGVVGEALASEATILGATVFLLSRNNQDAQEMIVEVESYQKDFPQAILIHAANMPTLAQVPILSVENIHYSVTFGQQVLGTSNVHVQSEQWIDDSIIAFIEGQQFDVTKASQFAREFWSWLLKKDAIK
ncbi:MAG: bifunctional phosphopantothenoylcysteine decarboxylase/phosphopantothenate--cysteine ligase CoaBC [Lysinibacillus sp.]